MSTSSASRSTAGSRELGESETLSESSKEFPNNSIMARSFRAGLNRDRVSCEGSVEAAERDGERRCTM